MVKQKRPTKAECLVSQCHRCCGYYVDGKADCENVTCSLYEYMPYRELKPDYNWRQYNPKRVGLVTFAESKRGVELSEAQKKAMSERLQEAKVQKREMMIAQQKEIEKELEKDLEKTEDDENDDWMEEETTNGIDEDDDLDW